MSDRPAEQFAETLRRLRMTAGLTQEALAERAGLSVGGISDLERGRRRIPRLATVRLLADALGLDEPARAELTLASRPLSKNGAASTAPPRAAATPATPNAPRHNLPLTEGPLIGRDHAVADICAMLSRPDTRLVTLTGPGGAGKTRLSLEVATRLADAFDEHVFFVPLAPLAAADLVVPAIVEALHIRESGAASLLSLVCAHLRGMTALLVLDNFEHVLAAVPAVSELLANCPQLTVMTTSRAALRLRPERLVDVAPLALPPLGAQLSVADVDRFGALALFVDRARLTHSRFAVSSANVADINAICQRLDGLPLAIELAAARTRVVSPRELLALLDPRLPILSNGARDVPARQQTMRNTIGWSYGLLTDAERRLFRQLGVFAGGWSLAAAAAVAELDNLAVLDGLTALVDASLVQYRELADGVSRFTMLETIREYANEQLVAHGELDGARARHAAYFRKLAEIDYSNFTTHTRNVMKHISEQVAWLADFEREHDNFRAALRWSFEYDPQDTGVTLVHRLGKFWYDHCHYVEAHGWMHAMLERAGPVKSASRAAALFWMASIGWKQSHDERSIPAAEEALAVARSIGDYEDAADALLFLANIALHAHHDADRVEQLLMEPDNDVRPRNESNLRFTFLGVAARLKGDVERAEKLFAEVLDNARERQPYQWYFVAISWGWMALDQGQLDQAESLAREATVAVRWLGHPVGQAEGLRLCACVASSRAQHARAIRLFAAAARLTNDHRNANAEDIADDRVRADVLLAASREALGAEACDEAWQAGRALSLDEAVEYALSG